MRLEEYLRDHALCKPEHCAITQGSERISYRLLWKNIQDCADQLRANGLEMHRPYVFRASQDASFVATYCAVHLLNAIAVPLEHSVSDEIFNKVKNEVEACQYPADITDILYTTGTSGQAKGVMLSQTCLSACADNFIRSSLLSLADRSITLPHFSRYTPSLPWAAHCVFSTGCGI